MCEENNIKNAERVIAVGLNIKETEEEFAESMAELEELIRAAGGEVISTVIQNRNVRDSTFYIGRGKAEEIARAAEELEIDTIVFNQELTGSQLRNLEKVIDRKVVDRTNLILDIFAERASSNEGKLQVMLAQLKYRLPRLMGYGKYLSRTGGGIGTRGPGEQKLDIDRRHILRETDHIKKKLELAQKNREVKRKQRQSNELPLISLVGYTNAGKSTIMNSLLDRCFQAETKKVFEKDMLFATLDTSLRKISLPDRREFILSDTVGFVSNLPTMLIEAFKGTLEEVVYSDIILNVVDASRENVDMQLKTTLQILRELEVLDKKILTVFNKMDKVNSDKIHYFDRQQYECIEISAKTPEGITLLLDKIEEMLSGSESEVRLLIPFSDYILVDYFKKKYGSVVLKHLEMGTELQLRMDVEDRKRYKEYILS